MVAGQLVFPIIMGVVILFVGGYAVSTPATPAPDEPEQRLIRVEPGDQVLVEVTGFYGEPGGGKVFFSTQEERRDSLPTGPDVEARLQENPVSYRILAEDGRTAQGLDKALLGHRTGDKVNTPRIAPEFAFGDWDETLNLPRAVATLPVRIEFNEDTLFQTGRAFNATEYANHFKTQGHTLEPGTVWPCEDAPATDGTIALWKCRLVTLDLAANVVVYDRLINDGESFPLAAVLDVNTVGGAAWDFTTQKTGDGTQFQLLLDPPVGIVFQLEEDLRDPYKAGTYRVESKDAQSLRMRYAAPPPEYGVDPNVNLPHPGLVGHPVYYEIEILRILRG